MKIVLSAVLLLLLVGCSNEKAEQTKEVQNTSKVETVTKVTEISKEKNTAVQVEKKIVKQAPVVEAKIETPKAKKIVTKEEKKVIKKAPAVKQVVKKKVVSTIDGSKIFLKCSTCHGSKAEKKALNKSHVIQGWSVSKITTAINGYTKGTYGGSMKDVMKAQVGSLTKPEIKAVAEYISKLK